jgi:SAM-dependent methyltransferase
MAFADTLLPEAEKPRTVLDAGAGTGASALAACCVFPVETVTCLERNPFMRAAGERILAGARAGALIRAESRWLEVDLTRPDPLPVRSDLVVASYVLNELSPEDALRAALGMWAAAGHLLVLVEPGTPKAFAGLRALRQPLLDAGAHLLAPCPHQGPCPLPPEDWCHFTVRVARSRLAKALKGGDAPYEDEKFSCLILSLSCSCFSAGMLASKSSSFVLSLFAMTRQTTAKMPTTTSATTIQMIVSVKLIPHMLPNLLTICVTVFAPHFYLSTENISLQAY